MGTPPGEWPVREGRGNEMQTKKTPCTKIVEKMYLMLEGEKSGSLCKSLRAHLDGCEACAEQYRVLQDLVSLCQSFPDEEVSEDQKKRMKEELLKALSGVRPSGNVPSP